MSNEYIPVVVFAVFSGTLIALGFLADYALRLQRRAQAEKEAQKPTA
jgi:hypothetical protein